MVTTVMSMPSAQIFLEVFCALAMPLTLEMGLHVPPVLVLAATHILTPMDYGVVKTNERKPWQDMARDVIAA